MSIGEQDIWQIEKRTRELENTRAGEHENMRREEEENKITVENKRTLEQVNREKRTIYKKNSTLLIKNSKK